MKPPICEICGKRFDPENGALVSFKMSSEDQDWLRRAKTQPGFVGHPPWMEWFCSEHASFFQKHQHLTLAEAIRLFRNHRDSG